MKNIVLSFLFLPCFGLFGQIISPVPTASSVGRGNVSSAIPDPVNLVNNFASVPEDSGSHIMAGLSLYHNIPGLYSVYAGYSRNWKRFRWGLALSKTGTNFFHQQELGLSLSQKQGMARLGGRVKWVERGAPELVVFHHFEFDLAGVVELGSRWRIGMLATNLNRSKYNGNFPETVPLTLTLGLSCQVNSNFRIATQIYDREKFNPVIGVGWDYQFLPGLVIRSGITNQPAKFHFGLSIGRNLQLGYGNSVQSLFGSVHAWDFVLSY